jgi:hypothetical protein
MMPGYFAALAAQELASTIARLKIEQEEQARRAAADAAEAQRRFDLLRQQHEALHGVVIDVDAREVPDLPALPAP